MDHAVLLGGQGLHDRRLDDRDQGHVGIGGHGDRAQHMGRDLGRDINGGRAVNGADGTDGSGFREAPVQGGDEFREDAAQDQGAVNTELTGSAQDDHFRHSQQRAEVDHRSDTDKDQEREQFGGDTGVIKDFHEPRLFQAVDLDGLVSGHTQVRQHAAEADGQKQVRFIFFDDRQPDQHEADHKHYDFFPAEEIKRVNNTAEVHMPPLSLRRSSGPVRVSRCRLC